MSNLHESTPFVSTPQNTPFFKGSSMETPTPVRELDLHLKTKSKWQNLVSIISRAEGWYRTADAILLVQIKSAKGIKNTYNIAEKMRPYVILKFGDYEGRTRVYKGDHSEVEDEAESSSKTSSSLLNPSWDAETSSFVCPFRMNTNLSLILMQESENVHYPCGHVTTNFPTYPSSDPPKLDRPVKFVRRLMVLRAGVKEEQTLRDTIGIYRDRVASQDVLQKATSAPSAIRKSSSAGKLSFKVTIVRRSTFDQHLKMSQEIPRMKSLSQVDRRQVLVYFSKAELDRYPWIKKESLVKIHTSLLKLQRQDPTQTEKTEIIVGSEVEYKDSTTGMSKLGVVCAKDEEIAHVADSSSLHRVVPWCKNAQFKGFEGSLAELVSDDKKLLEAQPTVSAEALTGDVDGEINWTKFRRSIQYLMFAHPDTHVDDSDIKTKDDASDWPKLIFLQGCRGDNSSIPVLLGVTDLKTGTLPDRQGAKKLTLQMRAPNASEMVELHEFEGDTSKIPIGQRNHVYGSKVTVDVSVFDPYEISQKILSALIQKARSRKMSREKLKAQSPGFAADSATLKSLHKKIEELEKTRLRHLEQIDALQSGGEGGQELETLRKSKEDLKSKIIKLNDKITRKDKEIETKKKQMKRLHKKIDKLQGASSSDEDSSSENSDSESSVGVSSDVAEIPGRKNGSKRRKKKKKKKKKKKRSQGGCWGCCGGGHY